MARYVWSSSRKRRRPRSRRLLAEAQQRVADRLASWSADLERTEQPHQRARQAPGAPADPRRSGVENETDREKIDEVGDFQAAAFAKLREELQHTADGAAASVAGARGPRGGRSPRRRRDEAAPQGAGPEADRTNGTRGARRRQEDPGQVRRRRAPAAGDTGTTDGPGCRPLRRGGGAAVRQPEERTARTPPAGFARELDRAVHMFAREAESVLAERLAQVADSGTQRVEKRPAQVTPTWSGSATNSSVRSHKRLAQLELELRERMRGLRTTGGAAALDRLPPGAHPARGRDDLGRTSPGLILQLPPGRVRL